MPGGGPRRSGCAEEQGGQRSELAVKKLRIRRGALGHRLPQLSCPAFEVRELLDQQADIHRVGGFGRTRLGPSPP